MTSYFSVLTSFTVGPSESRGTITIIVLFITCASILAWIHWFTEQGYNMVYNKLYTGLAYRTDYMLYINLSKSMAHKTGLQHDIQQITYGPTSDNGVTTLCATNYTRVLLKEQGMVYIRLYMGLAQRTGLLLLDLSTMMSILMFLIEYPSFSTGSES